jgi:hypothetical protein
MSGSTMTVLRILYGLDHLPSTLAVDDPRLPGVNPGPAPLRLNSVPLPIAVQADHPASDHAARMATVLAWLLAGCGDYNEPLRRGVTHYLDAIAAHVTHHRDILAVGLARFGGLYRPEDWFWSALRPLPRAWWRQDGALLHADLAFWNGDTVIAMHPRDFDSGKLPLSFEHFWNRETLPVSPFRRPFPAMPDELSLRPSSP